MWMWMHSLTHLLRDLVLLDSFELFVVLFFGRILFRFRFLEVLRLELLMRRKKSF